MPDSRTFIDQQLIGPYAIGEVPAPLQITFKDNDDVVMDLTSYTASFEIIRLDDTTPSGIGAGVSSIPTPVSGITQYAWVAADFLTAGHYRGVMWVGDGSNRYSSEWFEWFVRDTGTTVPSI